MRFRPLLRAGILVLASGCSLALPISEAADDVKDGSLDVDAQDGALDGDAQDGGLDGDAQDGALDGDAQDGASDGDGSGDSGPPPNLIQNGSFELGCNASWSPYQATLTDDSEARTGVRSCRVCNTANTGGWIRGIAISQVTGYTHGQTYWIEACVRTALPNPPPPSVNVRLGVYNSSGGGVVYGPDNPKPVSDEWTCHLGSINDSSAAGADFAPMVWFPHMAAGSCFLVDDIRVFTTP